VVTRSVTARAHSCGRDWENHSDHHSNDYGRCRIDIVEGVICQYRSKTSLRGVDDTEWKCGVWLFGRSVVCDVATLRRYHVAAVLLPTYFFTTTRDDATTHEDARCKTQEESIHDS